MGKNVKVILHSPTSWLFFIIKIIIGKVKETAFKLF